MYNLKCFGLEKNLSMSINKYNNKQYISIIIKKVVKSNLK